MKLHRRTILEHIAGEKRELYNRSFLGELPTDQDKTARAMRTTRTRFKTRKIKWYCIYDLVLDTDTGAMEFIAIESAAHEEIPPLELNPAAKGFIPPPTSPKKKAGLFGASLAGIPPPAFQQVQPTQMYFQTNGGDPAAAWLAQLDQQEL